VAAKNVLPISVLNSNILVQPAQASFQSFFGGFCSFFQFGSNDSNLISYEKNFFELDF
jgi:hypothetical protein